MSIKHFAAIVAPVVIGLIATPVLARAVDATSLLRNLDLSSFDNSTGPRRVKGQKTPAEYGFTNASTADGMAVLVDPRLKWEMRLVILHRSPHHIVICFADQARNGGTYNAEQVLDLTRGRDGLYEAREEAATVDCPTRLGQG